MTPKEKALELVRKYDLMQTCIEESKQCALIAVDEILNFIRISEIENIYWVNYWQEVKQEIHNL